MRRARIAQRLAVLAIPLLLLGVETARAEKWSEDPGAQERANRVRRGRPVNPTGDPNLATCTHAERAAAENTYYKCKIPGYKDSWCLNQFRSTLFQCGAVNP